MEETQEKQKIIERMRNLKFKKNASIFLILVILIILGIILLKNVFKQENVGNSIGNIRNYGYAAKSGKWIYFISPSEDIKQMGIFKIKQGDTEQKTKKELVKDEWSLLSLNVFKDYVYFIAELPETFSDEDEINNKIYRMKTDGTDLEVINDNEFSNDCTEIYLINNWVYYIGTDYNIYRMSLDGKNRELVLNNGTGYLGITEKYIIYNEKNGENTGFVTYVADIDGKNCKPIIEDTRLYSVNIIDNYVYYTNSEKNICRVRIDGNDQAVLYKETAYNMNVVGQNIYYLNYVDATNANYTVCIYRVKTNGSTKEPEVVKELEKQSSFIDVIDDWIVYMDGNATNSFIKLLEANSKEEINVYSLNLKSINNNEEYEATEDKDTSNDLEK